MDGTRSQKYTPSFWTLLLDKSGGAFARIFSLSHAYNPSLCSRSLEFDDHGNCRGFLKERQLCCYRKSAGLVLILSQEAPKQLAASVRVTKTSAVARKRGDSDFVRTCLQILSTTELNQKLTKPSQKMLDTGRAFTQGKSTYVKT